MATSDCIRGFVGVPKESDEVMFINRTAKNLRSLSDANLKSR